MMQGIVLLWLATTVSAYTIVQTTGSRNTGIDGMQLPLFTVQLEKGETFTDAQKVEAYQAWYKATTDYLSTTGNDSPAALREAAFCYSGPPLYPPATETLPPTPICDDFITVYNNTTSETQDFLTQLKNATRRSELMSSGQYAILLQQQEEKLRVLQGCFPGMKSSMVDDLKAQVDEILKAPSTADIISAAVRAVLGDSTNQTQIDQARLLFNDLLSANKTSFTQADIDAAAKSLFGTAGGTLNSTVLAAITKQLQNSSWVAEARGSMFPGDSFIDEIVLACGNATNSKNFSAFLSDLVQARTMGEYNSSVVSRFLSKYFGDMCLRKVPGLPFRVWWWTGRGGFLDTLVSEFSNRNATTIDQAMRNTGNSWYDNLLKQQNKAATDVSTFVKNVSNAANNGFQNAVNTITNFFKGFG
ncbi:hypothetical protein PMAYCL1PPCAC_12933 [Pristionchus mayeri]|uniref:SXP/RAL-2 family protein Ani s 5-like cation-binding domain-containing protein n=1 Tax=Pristionchus mayeri TaxID=1317129 RepID=A0AAN5C9D9_9BILA|nr:hypothetical protein PMAYCL1PPCAC_12933 [Pristionchus mayeri]